MQLNDSSGSAYVYDMLTGAWTLSHQRFQCANTLATEKPTTNMVTTAKGKLSFVSDGNIAMVNDNNQDVD